MKTQSAVNENTSNLKTHIIHDANGIFPVASIGCRVLKKTHYIDANGDVEYVEYLPEVNAEAWLHNGRCQSLIKWENPNQ